MARRRTTLAALPRVDVLRLSEIVSLPGWHPEAASFVPFAVHGFLIHHPDGPIVFDTGIGHGNADIDSAYGHKSEDLIAELHRHHVDERDIVCLANSHLHFDHCGQNHKLRVPIFVQGAEQAAAQEPGYTIPEWAAIDPVLARMVDGDIELAPGVRALLTPGHTPGHQSIVIDAADGCIVIAAQCIFRASAWSDGVEDTNLHDPSWREAAAESLNRLRACAPTQVLLSHDVAIDAPNGQNFK